jgi:putative ABC transport system ATP-binding protein
VLIAISGLNAGYGTRHGATTVLNNFSLNIAKGEHTLLLGPSGSGKTTLLNILAGLSAANSGNVVIDGRDLTKLTPSERDRVRGQSVGLVMQRLHLISALTVEKNLRLAQQLAGKTHDAARINATLATLGMAVKANKFPRELSQGEAQRVAIARAVINRPAIILADEPTSALDDANCEAAIDLLFAQADEQQATLIVATHDARIKARFVRVVTLGATT